MTEPEARELVQRMTQLWTKWTPTPEQISIWVTVFTHAEEDKAWQALRSTYAQNARYTTPNPKDYHEQYMVLAGPIDQGVYSDDGPVMSPLYLKQIESRKPRPGKKQRTSTWAYPHGLPDEEKMLKDAEKEWDWLCKAYGGKWQIIDSRVTGVSNPSEA